jgi:Raf kinase inhibitor-like YbhB/YbcL family protein
MNFTSSAFTHEGKIPSKCTCDGENVNPPLGISGIPENAESLALIMEDPDVPRNLREDGMWDHWVVFNMPPDLTDIQEGAEPPGAAGIGTNGETGYMGPCPPDREHRYFFKLFALDTMLDLPEKSTKADVEAAVEDHILDEAVLMGRYERT